VHDLLVFICSLVAFVVVNCNTGTELAFHCDLCRRPSIGISLVSVGFNCKIYVDNLYYFVQKQAGCSIITISRVN